MVCGVSMDAFFHGGLNETVGGRVRFRRPEILPFWFEVALQPQGSLIRVCEMSMDASFHSGSNETIGGCVRPQRPEILLSSQGGILVLAKRFTDLQKEQASVVTTVNDTGDKIVPGVVDT
jgi:hypothetical protein